MNQETKAGRGALDKLRSPKKESFLLKRKTTGFNLGVELLRRLSIILKKMMTLVEIILGLDKLSNHRRDRLKKNNSMGDKMTTAQDFLDKNLEQERHLSSNKTNQGNSALSSGEMMEETSEKIKTMLGQEEEEEAPRNLKFFSTIIREVKNKRQQLSNCNKIIKCV